MTVAQKGNQSFIYSRQGQNADQQHRDRSEYNNWAVSQTSHDPANNGGQMNPDYLRAIGACLDGRGYTSERPSPKGEGFKLRLKPVRVGHAADCLTRP